MLSVCTESVPFSIYGDSMGSALYLRLPQGASITACDRDQRLSSFVTCQIGKHSYREPAWKVSFSSSQRRHSIFHPLQDLSLRITQKIPPISRATPEIHFTSSTLKIVMNFYILKEIVFQQKKFVRYVSFRNCERGEILCDISQSVYTRRRIITFCFILDDLSYSRTFQNGRNHANRFEDERGEEVRKQ